MGFLQPLLLFGLPLIALPIIIHLINQRRYQSIRWAAMIFLLAANRMSRGYARLRQLLILLVRTAAIAALIFAVSRPLASGWVGRIGGGKPDTTIILLDRSPSMRQQGPGTVTSKLEAGRQQLARTLDVLGSTHWVLIESTTNVAREIESPAALLNLAATEPSSTSADLPAMLEAARDYVVANQAGRTDLWICSDLRQNDWGPESARWQALRDALQELPQGVRINLLAYADVASNNLSIRVTNVRRLQTTDGAELFVSLYLARDGNAEGKLNVPVQFEIEGARSEVNVEMTGSTFEVKDHRIPIERTRERGWGKVAIPADGNPGDNEYYFVFDKPQPRRTVIVSDDPDSVAALHLAAMITPDPAIECTAEITKPDQAATIDWEGVAFLVWHAPLPGLDAADAVQGFVNRGGQVFFVPPTGADETTFLGARWLSWAEEQEGLTVETWRGDQDLLANVQSGASLPVGQLLIRRARRLSGEMTPLATLKGGQPLLARVPTTRGAVYFCATTTASDDSSLAANGVVLYVMVQRALAAGAATLGLTRHHLAGELPAEQATTWRQVAGPAEAVSTDYVHHAGAYVDDDKLLAVNRAPGEDQATMLSDERVAELFRGLNFTRVDDQAGSLSGLIQEIWRSFLLGMLISLVAEAILCLPRRSTTTVGTPGTVERPAFAGASG